MKPHSEHEIFVQLVKNFKLIYLGVLTSCRNGLSGVTINLSVLDGFWVMKLRRRNANHREGELCLTEL